MSQFMIRMFSLAAGFLLVTPAVPTLRAADPATEQQADQVADVWCNLSIRVPEPWRRKRLGVHAVPGTVRCAWEGPNDSNVVVFVQEPDVPVIPRQILDQSAAALEEAYEVTVAVREVREVAGLRAMWLVINGQGTGAGMNGTGEVATTQHWVAVPRKTDLVVVLLTCPTEDFPSLSKSFESAVASLEMEGEQTAEQKMSE